MTFRVFCISLLSALCIPAGAKVGAVSNQNQVVEIDLQTVVQKVKSENYLVLETALRVYQAKQGIQVARRNLLPKLNVWRLIGLTFDVKGVAGVIEDIAPFLIPANWFKAEEQKLFYLAQKEAYRALWANELLTAKALYFHVLLDRSIMEFVEESRRELKGIHKIAKAREVLGGTGQRLSTDISSRLLALDEDERSLYMLIKEDENLLAHLMGYEGSFQVRALPVEPPKMEQLQVLRFEDFEGKALASSPEIQQFIYLEQAAEKLKKERIFSFLGSSSLSQGIMGGMFDDFPVQDGLGFGTGASIRIDKAQKEILKVRGSGVREIIRRNLKLAVDNYNIDLENYLNLQKRVEITAGIKSRLYSRLRLGDSVEPLELVEASRNCVQAKIALEAVKYRFLSNEDRLSRVVFAGDYKDHPQGVEKLNNAK